MAEQYITQFGHLAKNTNTTFIPASVNDVAGLIASAMSVVEASRAHAPKPHA